MWHAVFDASAGTSSSIANSTYRLEDQVDQLFRAQLFHDRKQYEERRRMKPDERAKTPVVDTGPIFNSRGFA